MKTDFYLAVLLIAVGTYLIRAVPFVLSSKKVKGNKNQPQIKLFFQLMGPSMISALLVVSVESPLATLNYTSTDKRCAGFCGSRSQSLAVE